MSDFRIRITGVAAQGRHGANPGERDHPQEFVADLDVTVRVDGDSVDQTADYAELIEAARKVIADESFELLETLAGAIANVVSRFRNVISVTATVHKPAAAEALGVGDISAEATAHR